MDRVIVGTALMNDIRENMNWGEEIRGKIGFPQSKKVRIIQMTIYDLEKDFKMVTITR